MPHGVMQTSVIFSSVSDDSCSRRVCCRWGQCRLTTSGESSTIYWTKVDLRTVVATPSCDILTACCVVHAASPLDRHSAASPVLLPAPLPRPASSICPVHIIPIIGTEASVAAVIPRRAVIRRRPTRSWWMDILQVDLPFILMTVFSC